MIGENDIQKYHIDLTECNWWIVKEVDIFTYI